MADVLSPSALSRFLRADARRIGFEAIGIAPAAGNALVGERLDAFVAAGHHGTMDWLPETAERRRSVTALWPEARSVIVLGLNYGPDEDPFAILKRSDRGAISVYARHRDYHDVVKGKLKELAGRLVARAGPRDDGGTHDAKVFVDTAPLMEKPLAETAGLGWQGKHTNIVSREFGSWLFLGSVVTTIRWRPTSRRATFAAPAGPARTSARRAPSPSPTASTRGAASPTSRSRRARRCRAACAR